MNYWPACFDLLNTLFKHIMNKDYILLIIFATILKGIASNCICGKSASRHKGKDADIKEHPWQILIEIQFLSKGKLKSKCVLDVYRPGQPNFHYS